MRGFAASELSRMRNEQESSLQDAGRHWIRQITQDANGQQSESYDEGDTVSCGFEPTEQSEALLDQSVAGDVQTVIKSAVLRLPLAMLDTIQDGDRFELLARYGTDLDLPLMFQLVGSPRPGTTGIVIDLREVSP